MPEPSGWGLFAFLYVVFVLINAIIVSYTNHKHPEWEWNAIVTPTLAVVLAVVALIFTFAPKNEPIWFIPLTIVPAGSLAWFFRRGRPGCYGISKCLIAVVITVAAFYNQRFPDLIAQVTAVIVGIYLVVEALDDLERQGWLDGLRRHSPTTN
jgi:hypothetical protein